jgi:D-tyrosyl-tRNA(Tyr) deacylase
MRLVIQRVTEASVKIDGRIHGAIGAGLVVLVGIARPDTRQSAEYCASKLIDLRLFNDEAGKMNRSVVDAGGSLLVVSQFTLYGDCRKGRRPGFDKAAPPEQALPIYNYFVDLLRRGPVPVETGVFQAHMSVSLVNDGPVTLWLESPDRNPE